MMSIAHTVCGNWEKVTELITGSDSQVWGAVVQVSTNEIPITLCRPLPCLYPLEVIPKPDTDVNNPPTTDGVMKASQLDDSETHTRHENLESQESKFVSDNLTCKTHCMFCCIMYHPELTSGQLGGVWHVCMA